MSGTLAVVAACVCGLILLTAISVYLTARQVNGFLKKVSEEEEDRAEDECASGREDGQATPPVSANERAAENVHTVDETNETMTGA